MAQGCEDDREERSSPHKVYIGNLAPDVSSEAVEDVVKKCGDVDRVIMKRGFCFCYFKSYDDAQACITDYDDRECQEISDHRLRVEMARGREPARFKSDREIPPNRNLFVVNYDPEGTTREDLEKFFQQWGTVDRVQMKDKYSFIEFQDVEMATSALHESQSSQFNGRILTVEYVQSGAQKTRRGRDDEYEAPRHERRESERRPPPPRGWGRERPYERSDYYRYDAYDRYDHYDYYEYYGRDRYAPRDRYGPYPPPMSYHRGPPPPSYRSAPRYGSPVPRYSSRSPPPAPYPRPRSPGYSHPSHRGRGSRSP